MIKNYFISSPLLFNFQPELKNRKKWGHGCSGVRVSLLLAVGGLGLPRVLFG
jgi:hypothetical protein